MHSDISNKNNFCLGTLTLLITIRTQNNHFMLFLTISLIFHMIIYTAKCAWPTISLKHNFITLAYPLLEFNVHINRYFFNCSILRCYFEDVHQSCVLHQFFRAVNRGWVGNFSCPWTWCVCTRECATEVWHMQILCSPTGEYSAISDWSTWITWRFRIYTCI